MQIWSSSSSAFSSAADVSLLAVSSSANECKSGECVMHCPDDNILHDVTLHGSLLCTDDYNHHHSSDCWLQMIIMIIMMTNEEKGNYKTKLFFYLKIHC